MADEPAVTTEEATPVASAPRPRGLPVVTAWQVVLGVAGLVAGVLVLTGALLDLSGLAMWLVAGLMLALGAASTASAVWLSRGRHRGRATAMAADYVVFVAFALIALQNMGVFIGADTLGANFHNWAWLLLVIAIGWVANSQAHRFGSMENTVSVVGRWIMIGGAAALLLAVGLIPAIATFFVRLVELDVLVPAVIATVGAVAFWTLRRNDMGRFFRTTRDQEEAMDGYLFASPNVIGFLAFFAGPLLFSLFVSFTSWDGLTDIEWIGLENYQQIFSLQFTTIGDGQTAVDVLKEGYAEWFSVGDFVVGARDVVFWISMRNILVFGFIAVPLAVFPALVLASLLNTKLPGVKAFRAIYFVPAVAGVVGITLIWKQLLNSTVGFINYGISRTYDVINLVPGVDLGAPQPEWLSSSDVALFSVVIVFAWSVIGFNTVLFLAGMQGINESLYEAASIDGAGNWKKFWNITVPMLRPTTVFVVATTTILALQLFNEPFILFAPQLPPTGPNNATATPVVHLYQEAFQRFNQGYASAVAWVLFLLIFGITLLYFRRQREEGAA